MIQAVITPKHFTIAAALVDSLDRRGMPFGEIALVLVAGLTLMAEESKQPAESIENFIAILAQVRPERGPLVVAVLNAFAEIIEPS